MVCASTFMILTVRFTTAIPRWISRGSVCAAIPAFWQFKSVLFGEMARRFNLETEAELFWQDEATRAKLGKWFFDRPRDLPIVIASASPEFELQYAAKLLGVPTLIGTKCDVKTGALIGKNCKGEEKLRRIEQNIGPFEIRAMYTDDAKADGPLLAAAQEGYIVTHGALALFQG